MRKRGDHEVDVSDTIYFLKQQRLGARAYLRQLKKLKKGLLAEEKTFEAARAEQLIDVQQYSVNKLTAAISILSM